MFNLPDGVTVNNPDIFLVDNRFVPPGGPAAVMEPATLALLGIGLAGISLGRRRMTG